jgi:hypothetical protein
MAVDFGTLRTNHFLIPVTVLLIAGIVVAQFAIPFGWALAGLYLAPVSVCAFWSSFRHVFLVLWITTLCTVLSTVLFFGSPFWDSKITMAMAYVLPVGSIWFVALMSVSRKLLERKSKQRATLQTLCPSCRQIASDGKMWKVEQYANERPSACIGIRLCDGCVAKRGMAY